MFALFNQSEGTHRDFQVTVFKQQQIKRHHKANEASRREEQHRNELYSHHGERRCSSLSMSMQVFETFEFRAHISEGFNE